MVRSNFQSEVFREKIGAASQSGQGFKDASEGPKIISTVWKIVYRFDELCWMFVDNVRQTDGKMSPCSWWLLLFTFGVIAASCRGNRHCMNGITINVILLEDDESPWSLKYMKKQILKAIADDTAIGSAEGAGFNLTANFEGFNTTIYAQRGCSSSACEAVEKLHKLMVTGGLGCAVLGPTCTFATFPLVDAEKGFNLSTPIISAGSFGPSCDYALNLLRVLPPARKITDFLINFWEHEDIIKPQWKTTYIYKKLNNTEDCF
ncbi:hypothetical protein AMECASPLE_016016, partial [Ameca splendens]